MKLFLSDIKKIDWLWDVIPTDLKEKKSGQYFIFYYDNIEETSSIEMKYHQIADKIDDRVFQVQYKQRAQNFGFFKDTFMTDNMLFYMFLKFYLTLYIDSSSMELYDTTEEKNQVIEKLDKLFLDWKSQDLQNLRAEGISEDKGIYEINNLSNLESAVHNFVRLPQYRNGVIKGFELVDTYFKSKYQHSLYGKKLKKVVQLINSPSGGILTETGGSVRYMLVGEHSAKAISDGTLDKAKELLRKGTDPLLIRTETGWYMNPFDGKWRKRISDKEMKLNFDKYLPYNDSRLGEIMLYAPLSNGITREDVWSAVGSSAQSSSKVIELIKNGYEGSIGDAVIHPLLFEYYPEIKNIPFFSAFHTRSQAYERGEYSYYFSPTPKHLNMYGLMNNSAKYVMLHEMQHYIQMKEGFANGGNLHVSELIVAVGGDNIRQFMSMFHQAIKRFCSDAHTMDLDRLVNFFKNERNPDMKVVRPYFESGQAIIRDCETAFQVFSKYYSLYWQKTPTLRNLTREVFGDYYKEFFDLVAHGDEKKRNQREFLERKGWSREEIHTLFFHTYQSLAGEFESREVQHSAEISEDLLDYFKFYSSESLRQSDVNVVFREGIMEDVAEHLGALELTEEDTYIIHVKPTMFGENMLHELGHILEDEAMKEPYYEIISKAYTEVGQAKFDSISEFFVECFLGWYCRRKVDEDLCSELKKNRVFPQLLKTDKVFNYMFGYESERLDNIGLDKCYQFVDKLLKII